MNNIVNDFVLDLTVADIFRGQGMDPTSRQAGKEALIIAAEKAINLGMPLLEPVALINEYKVKHVSPRQILLENNRALTCTHITPSFADAERINIVLCTIGSKLEQLVVLEQRKNPVLSLALDGLGNVAVESIAQEICKRITKQAMDSSMQASAPVSPGDPKWPIDVGQPEIFALVDSSLIGINLTQESRMIPAKSVSFIVGVGKKIKRARICTLCNMKERCHFRNG